MNVVLTALAVLGGLLGGFWAGFALGERYRGEVRRYWTFNGLVVAGSMLANFAGLVLGWPALSYGALGVMGGALTGLKYGYSESIGVWRTVDRITGVEPLQTPEESESAQDPEAT